MPVSQHRELVVLCELNLAFPTLQYGFRAAFDRHYNYLSNMIYAGISLPRESLCLPSTKHLVCREPQITTAVLSIKFCNENDKHGQLFYHHYIFKIFPCALLVGSYKVHPQKRWSLMMARPLNVIFIAISYIKMHILIWILANKINFHSCHADAYTFFVGDRHLVCW